jgi:hypothetical protein
MKIEHTFEGFRVFALQLISSNVLKNQKFVIVGEGYYFAFFQLFLEKLARRVGQAPTVNVDRNAKTTRLAWPGGFTIFFAPPSLPFLEETEPDYLFVLVDESKALGRVLKDTVQPYLMKQDTEAVVIGVKK